MSSDMESGGGPQDGAGDRRSGGERRETERRTGSRRTPPQEPFWNHRVVHRRYPDSAEPDEDFYAIHEAHYAEGTPVDGMPRTITVEPVAPSECSLDDLRWVLQRMLRALDKPVIEYDEVGEEATAEGPAE